MGFTLTYEGKLRWTKQPEQIYDKMCTYIAKHKAASRWSATLLHDTVILDFGNGHSEPFVMEFHDGYVFGSYTPDVPVNLERLEIQKGDFRNLLSLLMTFQKSFQVWHIKDPYGLYQAYSVYKQLRIKVRDLTDSEYRRVFRIHRNGYKTPDAFLLAVITEDLGLSDCSELELHMNPNIDRELFRCPIRLYPILATWLYETASCRGFRVSELDPEVHPAHVISDVDADVKSFIFGIEHFFSVTSEKFGTIPGYLNEAVNQIRMLYEYIYLPALHAQYDTAMQMLVVYRHFVSIYEYLGFTFVGSKTPVIV